MKVLVCLFAVLAVASAGYIRGNGLYSSNGLIGSASYVAPAALPAALPAILPAAPAVYRSAAYAAPASIYHAAAAPIYHAAAPIYHPAAAAPVIAAPISSYGYGLNNGIRYGYGSPYGFGGFKQ